MGIVTKTEVELLVIEMMEKALFFSFNEVDGYFRLGGEDNFLTASSAQTATSITLVKNTGGNGPGDTIIECADGSRFRISVTELDTEQLDVHPEVG